MIADWLSLSAICNNNVSACCTAPGQCLCCVCKFKTEEKTGKWHEHPFLMWQQDLDGTWSHCWVWNLQPSQALWNIRHLLMRALDFTLHHIENTLTAGSSSHLNVRSAFKDLMEDVFPKWKLAAVLTIKVVRAYHRHPFSFFHSLLLTKHPPLYTPDEEVL